jgi:hypothetical protein
MTADRGGAASAGAVVRKPSGKEPAGGCRGRCHARYGDFGAVPVEVVAADVAGGAMVERCGGGDGAWVTRRQETDTDLSMAALPG